MHAPRKFKKAFMERLLLSLQVAGLTSKSMGLRERRDAVRLSSDVAMASARARAALGARPRGAPRRRAPQRAAPTPHHGRRRLRARGLLRRRRRGEEQEDREEVAEGGVQLEEEAAEPGNGRGERRRRRIGGEEDGEGPAPAAPAARPRRRGAARLLAAKRDARLRRVPQDAGRAHAQPLQRIPAEAASAAGMKNQMLIYDPGMYVKMFSFKRID